MTAIEAFLAALLAAIAQGVAAALMQNAQQPSTAQDGYIDATLENQLKSAIAHPAAAD